jgi:hypothetical protein
MWQVLFAIMASHIGWEFGVLKLFVVTGGSIGVALSYRSLHRTPRRRAVKRSLLALGIVIFFAITVIAWLMQS